MAQVLAPSTLIEPNTSKRRRNRLGRTDPGCRYKGRRWSFSLYEWVSDDIDLLPEFAEY